MKQIKTSIGIFDTIDDAIRAEQEENECRPIDWVGLENVIRAVVDDKDSSSERKLIRIDRAMTAFTGR